MASRVEAEKGAGSGHCGACGCFGTRRSKSEPEKAIARPHRLERSTKRITERDVQEFNKMVKADGSEVEKGYDDEADSTTSTNEEEVKTVTEVFTKIHGEKEEKK